MKTLEYVLENYEEKYEVFMEDRFGRRLCKFLTDEQMSKIGFKYNGSEPREIKEWTRENILAQLEEDVEFGFEKALNKRGISSALMCEVVKNWNDILEEGLEDLDDYEYYGLPIFKATAVKYGWDNPIGDDSGGEEEYNSDE